MKNKKNKSLIFLCLLLIASLIMVNLSSTVNAANLTLTDTIYDSKTSFKNGSMTVKTPRGNLTINFTNSKTGAAYFTNSGGLTVSCTNGSNYYLCDASGAKKSSTTYAKLTSSDGRYTIAHFYVAYQVLAHRSANSTAWDYVKHSNGTSYAHSATIKSGSGHQVAAHYVVYEIKINTDMAGVSTASFGTAHQRRAKSRPVLTLTEATRTTSITWNAQGGSTPTGGATSKTDGSQVGTLASTSRTGYTLNGWFTASSGGNKIATNTVLCGTSVTFYAQWSINNYKLTANANGGTITSAPDWTIATDKKTASKNLNYNTAYGTLPTATRTGYTFDDWYTAASDGTKVSNTTTIGAGAATIYAHWKANTNTITLNPNTGTYTDPTSLTVTYDSTTNNSVGIPTKTDYAFKGWYTAASGGTQVYDANGKCTKNGNYWSAAGDTGVWKGTSNLTLYAQWVFIKECIIKYDPNGGTGTIANQTPLSGSTFNLSTNSDNAMKKTGYQLIGWATTQFTTKPEIALGGQYTATDDQTFYAVWRKTGAGFKQLPMFHDDMFTGDVALKGQNGTIYNPSQVDGSFAHVDGTDPKNTGITSGYFSVY